MPHISHSVVPSLRAMIAPDPQKQQCASVTPSMEPCAWRWRKASKLSGDRSLIVMPFIVEHVVHRQRACLDAHLVHPIFTQ